MKIIIGTLLLISTFAWGQMFPFPGPGVASPAPSSTPTFVSETSWNSTGTSSVTTRVAGTVTCANNSTCLSYGTPSLSGNLLIVAGKFAKSTTATPTGTDDVTNSYTCTTGGSKDSGTNDWPYLCYVINATAGANKPQIGFGATVTDVVARTAQFYNVATSVAVDGSLGSCAGASTTSPGCASVTTTVANDLIYAVFCPAGTPAIGSFTPGSGYTAGAADLQTGCVAEWKVNSGTGSVTPTATFGNATTYTEIVAAFKAASAGTAPTGAYLARMMSYSSVSPTTEGTIGFKFPNSAASLLVSTNSCNTITVSGVTDGTNTWTTNTANVSGNNLNESYVINASANSSGAISLTTSGSGDCTHKFYEFSGAPTSASVARGLFDDTVGGAATGWSAPNETTTASSVTFGGNPYNQIKYLSVPTVGISVMNGSQDFNTTLSVSSPSACYGDISTQGGENINGPWPVDQNNPFGHCITSTALTTELVWPNTSSTTDPGHYGVDVLSFYGSTGVAIVGAGSNQATSGSTLAVTMSKGITAGNGVVCAMSYYDGSTSRSVSKVCTDGGTCAAGNSFSHTFASGTPNSTYNSTQGGTDVWFLASAPSGAPSTITATFSGAVTAAGMYCVEAQKGSGSWAADVSNRTNNGSVASTTATGASVTTTGSVGVCVDSAGVSGTMSRAPKSGNEFIYGGVMYTNGLGGASALLTSTAGSHATAYTVNSGTFNDSIGCIK